MLVSIPAFTPECTCIQKLRAHTAINFKCACDGVTAGDDEDGEERSQAYFVIKAAQKREELQREGDELVCVCTCARMCVCSLYACAEAVTTVLVRFLRASACFAQHDAVRVISFCVICRTLRFASWSVR